MVMHTYTQRVSLRTVLTTVFAMGIFLSMASFTHAASTGFLLPAGDGAYTQWKPKAGTDHYTQVFEATSTCNGITDYVSEITAGERDSFTISLDSIPNGALITNISIIPCASRNSSGGGSATMDVFYRYNGVNSADSGAYALTGTTPVGLGATTFSGLSFTKSATATLEVGAIYSAGTKGARLSRIAMTATYVELPVVTTLSASTTAPTSTTLSAFGNPKGSTATGWFRYATTSPGVCNDTFGIRAPSVGGAALGAGTADVWYSQLITGLIPNTTYYYCGIASNTIGTGFGAVSSFTTLP